MKIDIFKIFKPNLSGDNNIHEIQKFNKAKRLCEDCQGDFKESVINGVKRTKRQNYSFLKTKSLDGKIRCRSCFIEWLEMKLDELI